ncbi:MAG: DUF1565 domain-containing protein [Myxococcota bacterium]
MRLVVRLAFSFILAGCDGDPAPVPDATSDGTSDASSESIYEAPHPEPARVNFLPCPSGWRPVFGLEGIVHCEPYSATGQETSCRNFGAHLPGRPGCEPLAPCSTGEFPSGLPPNAVFVRPRGTGDGSETGPFGTIAEALAAAPANGVIALATGTYSEALSIVRDVELRGVCPTQTIIESPGGPVVQVRGARVTLAGVRLGPGDDAGVVVADGEVSLQGVVVFATRGAGVGVGDGGRLTGSGVLIDGVSSDASGRFGRGLTVEGTGEADLSSVQIQDFSEVAVFASGTATLSDVVLTGEREIVFFERSPLVRAEDGGRITLRRAAILESPAQGVSVSSSELILEDTVIRGTEGEALRLSDGSQVTLRRVHTDEGLWPVLAFDGAEIEVDGWFARNASRQGVALARGARLTGRGLAVEDVADVGVFVSGQDSALSIEDFIIVRTTPGNSSTGRGLNLQEGAQATVRRFRAVDTRDAAIFVSSRASLEGSDLSIASTAPRAEDGRGGVGILAQDSATVRADVVQIIDSQGHGALAIGEGTELVLNGLTVDGVRPQACAESSCPEDGRGIGLGSYRNARAESEGFDVRSTALCSVMVAGDADLDLDLGVITDSEIGLCVVVPDYDLDRLNRQLLVRDVQRRVDAPVLPLPDFEQEARVDP